jgi:hypothetical protein
LHSQEEPVIGSYSHDFGSIDAPRGRRRGPCFPTESTEREKSDIGPGTHVEYANQAALDMWGVTAEQVLGKTGVEIGLVPIDEELNETPVLLCPGPQAAAAGEGDSQ